ncbi:MAG TPA: amidohydrolase family protein [Acidimicrobiales bacterium]|nr:amidohydrolase family protein [Acidimicrobiales bacterium]
MSRLVLTGARVVVGDGTALEATTVVLDGERIASVGPDTEGTGPAGGPRADDRVVELAGRTVMPGMVNCHFHATYHNLGATPAPFGLEEPMALQVVRAVRNLERLLLAGFTGAVSAGAPFAIDASMKTAIDRRLIAGPRLVPCSRDLSTTGHAGDTSFPAHWEIGALGAIRRSDGPEEFRRSVRLEVKEGAEMIKVFVTGGHGTVGPRERTELSADELAAAIGAAHERGARVRGHIANKEALLMALDLGIDIVDHGDGMDDECIERLLATDTPVVPSMLFPARFLASMGGSGLGFTDEMRHDIDTMAAVLPVANDAGVRLVLGDDFGALHFPHGPYADELAYYVEEIGIPSMDVLTWATRNGADVLGRGDELGTVTAGKLADLLVVDGDPVADVNVLRDADALLAVVQGGRLATDRLPGPTAGPG